MTEQPKEYKFGYFSRHKYQDLVFYVINEDGQTNTGLFEMPDTPENRALMEALIPRPVSIPPEGAAPETEPKCCHSTPCCLGCRQITAAAAAIKQERERIREAVSVLLDSVSKQSRKDEKKFDGYGSDYLYDRGKAAGVAIFCEQTVRKDILTIINNGGK